MIFLDADHTWIQIKSSEHTSLLSIKSFADNNKCFQAWIIRF